MELLGTGPTGRVSPGLIALADAARERHGDAVRAVLFYGSCLRSGRVEDGLADLYLLVDDYLSAFNSRVPAFFNMLLPPNVFYLEVLFEGDLLRAKYAVLTLADFRKGAERWFHSYLWGRFAQKTGIIFTRDELDARYVKQALACAVSRFIAQALPCMNSSFTARELWSKGLSLSYRAELRPEDAERAAERLFDDDPAYYQSLTTLILQASSAVVTVDDDPGCSCYQLTLPEQARRLNALRWRIRMIQGKVLSVLRLIKGFFTFKGGIDYILWKVERHSGVRVEVGAALRRVPPLALLVILWRLYRQKAFR